MFKDIVSENMYYTPIVLMYCNLERTYGDVY